MYHLQRIWNKQPKKITCMNTINFILRKFGSSQVINIVRPRRAILYVPGNDRRKIDKLRSLRVDCAVLDCEDGVAINQKHEARTIIKEVADSFDFGKTEFAVRVNSIDSGLAEEDLKIILSSKSLPDVIMFPKVQNIDHVIWINNALKSFLKGKVYTKKLNLVFYIESSISLLNMKYICEKAADLFTNQNFQLVGLVFGSDDFCADIGASRTESNLELLTARQMFVLTAKAFKMQAIDMVHINFKDTSGLKKSCDEAASFGFTGKQVIHPLQVPIVQKAFSPSAEKLEWAKQLIECFKDHQQKGTGAFTFQGAMIDKPLLLQAEYIVKMSENYNN